MYICMHMYVAATSVVRLPAVLAELVNHRSRDIELHGYHNVLPILSIPTHAPESSTEPPV